ncbi:MAG TPA: hypothetical protein VI168_12740 [Croceibacterium sp.]
MSLSAALILAAAAAVSTANAEPARGVRLARASVTATILPSVAVRQAEGPVRSDSAAPQHQLTRRGRTVLVEFQ